MKGRIRWKQIGPPSAHSSSDLPSAPADWRHRQELTRIGLRIAFRVLFVAVTLGTVAVLVIAAIR